MADLSNLNITQLEAMRTLTESRLKGLRREIDRLEKEHREQAQVLQDIRAAISTRRQTGQE